MEEHSYLNFDLLVFLPEIIDEEAIKERRYKKVTEDMRFVRTKTIVGKKDENFVPFDFKYDKKMDLIKAKENKNKKEESFEKEGGDDENFGEDDEKIDEPARESEKKAPSMAASQKGSVAGS